MTSLSERVVSKGADMASIAYCEESRSITQSDIDEAEKRMGFRFPEQFREHYLAHNGGQPLPNTFEKDGEEFMLNEISAIKYGRKGNCLEDWHRLLVLDEEGLFPPGLMPFGNDPGGDLFCFRLEGPKQGAICYWRHERPVGDDGAVVELADDLNSFLDALVISPD